jgi:predicted dithiol-disulfide oxidoreductase (DUF899 family)
MSPAPGSRWSSEISPVILAQVSGRSQFVRRAIEAIHHVPTSSPNMSTLSSTNSASAIPHPPIADQTEWLAARIRLLKREKEATRERDRVGAERRRLPMVRIEKDYDFDAPEGRVHLRDLFAGRRQLIVYHFMFDPSWEKGCPGCTGFVDALGDLSLLDKADTSFALVSRAPLPKLEDYRKKRGWNRRWVSSFGGDFNYDFHVTLDEKVHPVEYNYRSKEEMLAHHPDGLHEGETHGVSVFFRLGNDVYHTYSAYARGVESLTSAWYLLDITPYGRHEAWEDSPSGWPQHPTYG